MYIVTDIFRGVSAIVAVALALCVATTAASAEPKKKLPTDVRVVVKYMVIHGPPAHTPTGNMSVKSSTNNNTFQ